ncbi:MAG: radical SAM protein, partial [Deltaproteobacteria bacterium]|nr:radical SAM protein [Deltaproteobacteria bacterium]
MTSPDGGTPVNSPDFPGDSSGAGALPARRRGGGGTLALEVTGRCPLACCYCYNPWAATGEEAKDGADEEWGHAPGELPAAELVALAGKALAASGLGHVQVSGGEPLLYGALPALLAGLVALGRPVSLVTSGPLLSEATVAELARLGVGPVQPTLLAASRALHDELKGAKSFDATVAAIARLRQARVPVSVAFVCTARNHDRLAEVVELCFALGVKHIAFSRFCSAGAGLRNHAGLAPSLEMVRSCLDVAEWATARLETRVHVAIALPWCVA